MRRAFGAAACTLSLAAAVAGSSVTAASASTMASKTEHFRFVSTSASSPRASAIAWGAFTAGGTINTNSGLLRFPGGTFRAAHHRTNSVAQLNRNSCLFTVEEHGTYRLGHGTGRYRHISGRGKYTSRVRAVLARNSKGRCAQSRPPRAFQQVINAWGSVRGVALNRFPLRWATPGRLGR
jgi:hypothetical protein